MEDLEECVLSVGASMAITVAIRAQDVRGKRRQVICDVDHIVAGLGRV